MFRFGRIVLGLILIGLLIGGGALLYRAGMAQGYQLGAYSVAPVAGTPAPGTTVLPPAPYYAPYFYGPRFGPWGGYGFFNPFGAILGVIFFFFVLFAIGALVRLLFFRRFAHHGGWMGGPGMWAGWGRGPGGKGEHGPWSGEVPPFFKEWHDRAHQQAPETPAGSEPQEPAQQS